MTEIIWDGTLSHGVQILSEIRDTDQLTYHPASPPFMVFNDILIFAGDPIELVDA